MLSHITIHNFALIDSLSLTFSRGLTVFTGETGAGKSIVIDALRFALGERFDRNLVRDPTLPCSVEAVFEFSDRFIGTLPLDEDMIDQDEPQLIIYRSFLPDGRTQIKLNQRSITRNKLKELGDHLLDFHGPHDHQMLLQETAHRHILDRLSENEPLHAAYAQQYARYQEQTAALHRLHADAAGQERELDMLEFAVRELEQVCLDDEPYQNLVQERNRINNAEKIFSHAGSLLSLFDNEQSGIETGINQAFAAIKPLTLIDPSTQQLMDTLSRIQEDTSRFTTELRTYLDSLDFNGEYSTQVNERYDRYDTLLRKYGPSLADVRHYYQNSLRRREQLANFSQNDRQLQQQISECKIQLQATAEKISRLRHKTAQRLKKTIERELKELGFQHVEFSCRIDPAELNKYGGDLIRFFISPNSGEELKPLASIVSSGEAARVMLALKKALTAVDPIPVLVFDEIDAQIGGRLGSVTGKKVKALSADRQVLLITHLPQIASFADAHFKVSKQVVGHRTATRVERLTADTQVQELAQMLEGADRKSTVAIEHAQDMLRHAAAKNE